MKAVNVDFTEEYDEQELKWIGFFSSAIVSGTSTILPPRSNNRKIVELAKLMLTPTQFKYMYVRFVEAKSYSEISKMFNIKRESVYATTHRGCDKLLQIIYIIRGESQA